MDQTNIWPVDTDSKNKNWLSIFRVGMVKIECGQSGCRTLKLTVSQKQGINWFFGCLYKFRKAKSWFNEFWVGVVKMAMALSSWDPKTYCILITDLWTELMFWMLIVMQ